MINTELSELQRRLHDAHESSSRLRNTVELLRNAASRQDEVQVRLMDENARLRTAVEKLARTVEMVLRDEEAGDGWGPDVTTCGKLRESLKEYQAAVDADKKEDAKV